VISWGQDEGYYVLVTSDQLATSSPSPPFTYPGTMEPPFTYPGAPELLLFHNWYKTLHGHFATFVCVFGIVANVLNIIVLTRKNMISPTNCLLTGLAVSDGLTMAAYLPFALRFYVLYGTEFNPETSTLAAARFTLFYACFSVVVHTVSIWITVLLAVFRYDNYRSSGASLKKCAPLLLKNVTTNNHLHNRQADTSSNQPQLILCVSPI